MNIRYKTCIAFVISGLVFLAFLFITFSTIVESIVTHYKLKNETRYAITSSVSLSGNGGQTTHYRYTFRIGEKEYNGRSKIIRPGYHYFIKYYPPNPKYNDATNILATKEDIKNMPADGYLHLPHEQLPGVPSQYNFKAAFIFLFIVIALLIAYEIYRKRKMEGIYRI